MYQHPVLSAGVIILVLSVLVASIAVSLMPRLTFPEREVLDIASQYYHTDKGVACPMLGRVAIVTGSTSGLGKSIAFQMYKMGATVVVASRSESKCNATTETFQQYAAEHKPPCIGRAVPAAMDLSEFKSVIDFSVWFRHNFERLDVLVNNGAINYITSGTSADASAVTSEGLDLLFGTNYMGHFLLTDKLLPVLTATPFSTILQISSNSQFFVDGSDLMPPLDGSPPAAAKPSRSDDGHRKRAYGNSKFAQVLHAQALMEREKLQLETVRALSCSPGLTDTGMIPEGIFKAISSKLFYPTEAAMYSAFVALFRQSPAVSAGAYVHNSPSLMLDSAMGRQISAMSANGIIGRVFKPICTGVMFIGQCFYQNWHYGEIGLHPPQVPYRGDLATNLYSWSKAFIEKYEFENNNVVKGYKQPLDGAF